MTACMCVDYLAHEWDVNDIIQANHEIKKQLKQIKKKQQDADTKELKSIKIEHDKLIRFQNAVWRQMAKICTNQLGRSNAKINPSTVNWQKESDITWLYGPLYTTKPSLTFPPTPPPEGIKSVLKKPTSLHDDTYRPWSKTCSEPGGSSITVRFNPDIEEMEYIPESPIQSSLPPDTTYCWLDDDDDNDEDEEDDILISMVLDLVQFAAKKSKQWATSYLSAVTARKKRAATAQRPSYSPHLYHPYTTRQSTDLTTRASPLQLIVIFVSMTKSLSSLFATWLMYQSLLPFTWFINHSKKKHHHTTF